MQAYKLCSYGFSWMPWRSWSVKVLSARDLPKITLLQNKGWFVRDATYTEVERWYKSNSFRLIDVADEFFTETGKQLLLFNQDYSEKRLIKKEARRQKKEAKRAKKERRKAKQTTIGFNTSYEKEAVEDL